MKYENGLATATCGLGVKSEGRLLIAGTKGYIVVDGPWWKTSYFEVHYEDSSKVDKYSENFIDDGLSELLSLINQQGKNDFKLTKKESIALAGIMEEFVKENRNEKLIL